LSTSFLPKLEQGWTISRADYDSARALAHEFRPRFAGAMQDCDFLLTLSASDEAPRSFANTGSALFNRIWTWLDVPCLTLPHGRGPNGLPLGVQLIGCFEGDADLLTWGQWAAERLGSLPTAQGCRPFSA